MSETSKRFKMRRSVSNFLRASVLCSVFASAGCGYVAPSVAPSPMSQRIDWGMSLLAGGYVGNGQFPAKFSFDVNAPPDCANDFVVFNTSQANADGSFAQIVAFNNLYSTQGSVGGMCNQDGPSVYWSYFNNEGSARTSVALSLDGSKVAFVQTGGFGTAVLSILKWKAGEGSGVGSPVAVDQDISGSPWTACTDGNSCIAIVPFSGSVQDSHSAPYVDYANDVIYVGDSKGSLHKFTGVFNGTPTEVTSGWPILVNSTYALTSPVYDSASGNIFVGDASGRLSYVRDTSSMVGSCGTGSPPCLGALTQQVGTAGAIVDGPLLDSTSGFVFTVNGTDTLHNGTILQATTDLSNPVQFSIGGTGTTGTQALYDGAFDNTYYNSPAGSVAGFMYVCGKDPAQTNRPAIYQLSFTSAGVLNSVGTPLLMNSTSNNVVCSPVTEFNNTSSSPASGDWIFFSIGNRSPSAAPIPTNSNCRSSVDATNGGKGCILGINLTNAANPAINPAGTWPPVAAFFTAQGGNNNANAVALVNNVSGSSSGIIVDNVYEVYSISDGSNISQTSSIYFSIPGSGGAGPGLPTCNTMAGVGCAVKLTQSNLN
jgi:hypothetical protein